MSSLITLPKNEVETITKCYSADTTSTYNPRQLKTIEDCVDQYNKAEEVSHLAQSVIKDRMQGDALLKARKLICRDEWDFKKLSRSTEKSWGVFLDTIGLKGDSGRRQANYLLDFAGYKEDGGKIETASHFREVKKVSTTKTQTEIDELYDDAGGEELTTAKEVKEGLLTTPKTVYVRHLFEDEAGKCPERGANSTRLGTMMLQKTPSITAGEWKKWYHKVSLCLHPDHNKDSSDDMAILASINEMIQTVVDANKKNKEADLWEADFKMWKEDRGYKSDIIKEDEL